MLRTKLKRKFHEWRRRSKANPEFSEIIMAKCEKFSPALKKLRKRQMDDNETTSTLLALAQDSYQVNEHNLEHNVQLL